MKLTCLRHRLVYGFGGFAADQYLCIDCGRNLNWRGLFSIVLPDTRKNVVLANYARDLRRASLYGEKADSLEELCRLFKQAYNPPITPDFVHTGDRV